MSCVIKDRDPYGRGMTMLYILLCTRHTVCVQSTTRLQQLKKAKKLGTPQYGILDRNYGMRFFARNIQRHLPYVSARTLTPKYAAKKKLIFIARTLAPKYGEKETY